ncbi:MAG: hypothetical protein C4330_01560 [Chitinophagaceae bacterium]
MFSGKYLIGDTEQFNSNNYPELVAELSKMRAAMDKLSHIYSKEMLVAFVRDHHFTLEWINSNTEVYELLSSKSISTDCLEALFDACSHNELFRTQLEAYIAQQFAPSAISY